MNPPYKLVSGPKGRSFTDNKRILFVCGPEVALEEAQELVAKLNAETTESSANPE